MFRRNPRRQEKEPKSGDQIPPDEPGVSTNPSNKPELTDRDLELDLFKDDADAKKTSGDSALISDLESFELGKSHGSDIRETAPADDPPEVTDEEKLVDIDLDEESYVVTRDSQIPESDKRENEFLALQDELARLENECLSAKLERDAIASEHRDLENRLRQTQQDLQSARQSLQDAQAKPPELERELASLQEYIRGLEKSFAEVIETKNRLEVEVLNLQDKNAALTESFKDLNKQLSERNQTIPQLQNEIGQLNAGRNADKTKSDEVLTELAEAKSLHQQTLQQSDEFKSEIDNLKTQLETANDLVNELRAVDQDDNLPARVDSLESSIAASNQQLETEQSDHETTKANLAEVRAKLQSVQQDAEKREQIEPLKQLLKRLQTELNAEKRAHQDTRANVADLTAELHTAREQLLAAESSESGAKSATSPGLSIPDSFFAVGMSDHELQTVGSLSAAAQDKLKELDSALDRMQDELSHVDRDNIDLSIEPRFPRRPR